MKRLLSTVLGIAAFGLLVFALRQNERVASLEKDVAILKIVGPVPPGFKAGSSIPIILGGQCVGQSCAYELQPDWFPNGVPASTATNVWSMYPPLTHNEVIDICSFVQLTAQNITSADQGGWTLYCWRGGNFKGPDGGYQYVSFDGGQAELQNAQLGATLQASSSLATLVECWPDGGNNSHTLCANAFSNQIINAGVYESISARKPPIVVDSGPIDSGLDTGSDSGADAGPPGVISYVAPTWGPATGFGHYPITIDTSSGPSLVGATVTVAGVTCAVTSSATNEIICLPGDYGDSGGSPAGVGQVITITPTIGASFSTPLNADGGIDKQLAYFYQPSNLPVEMGHRGDVGLIIDAGAGVSYAADITANDAGGAPFLQGALSFQPTTGTNYGGTIFKDIVTDGTQQYMNTPVVTDGGTPPDIPSGEISACLMAKYVSVPGGAPTAMTLFDHGNGGQAQYVLTRSNGVNFQSTDFLTAQDYGLSDTNPHVWCIFVGAAGAVTQWEDLTSFSRTYTLQSLSGVSILGAFYNAFILSNFAPLDYMGDYSWQGQQSPADQLTIVTNFVAATTP